MTPQKLLYSVFILVWLPASQLRAQHKTSQTPATVKATVDKQKIIIGQPIQLMLEATIPGNLSLPWPLPDSLPHFEWMEKGKVDSVLRAGEKYYRQYLTITSFDSGAWSIPRLAFTVGKAKAFTDSIRIEVGYTPIDPSKDYHDIKDIIEVSNPWARWIPWIIIGVTLASLVLVIYLVRKRKISLPAIFRPGPKLTPYEEAMQQLDELAKQQLPVNGALKTYYTRLSDIFRVYLFKRLNISSLAETSEELIGQLHNAPLPPAQFDSLAETLRMSDFVKFAKYQPGIADAERHYEVIRSSISVLEPPPTTNPPNTK